jgi:hypothetical protein
MRTAFRTLILAVVAGVAGCAEAPPAQVPSPDEALLAVQTELAAVREELRTLTVRMDSLTPARSRPALASRRTPPRTSVRSRGVPVRTFAGAPAYTPPASASPAYAPPATTSPGYLPRELVSRSGAQRVALKRGPRGGCYYISSAGGKHYVDRSLCD